MLLRQLRRAVIFSLLLFVVCGLAYPLAESALAGALFPGQAQGSLGANGSALIGQAFSGSAFFHARPGSYNPQASGSTNLGPTSTKLVAQVKAQIAYWHSHGVQPTNNLVTTSGSGLDPDISPSSAYAQIPMIAHARHLAPSALHALVAREIHPRQLGFLGSPYVNVLQLNEALVGLAAGH